jgi:hypothetical protein
MPKIHGGYYLKARCVQNSTISTAPPHVREIWDWILREVNHKEGNSSGRVIARGECVRTYESILEGLKWKVGYRTERYSRSQCETAMKVLTREGMITTTKTTRGMVIKVVNYDKFQTPSNYENHNEIKTRTTREPQQSHTINKNDKNVKNDKNDKKDIKLHQKVDYLLNIPNKDINEFIGKFNVTEEIVKEKGEKFYYYCLSKGKDKGKDAYKNFKAALRNALSDFGKKLPEDVEMAKRIKATQEKSNISSPQSKELINKMKA